MPWIRLTFLGVLLLLSSGCSSYAGKIRYVQYLFDSAQYEPAALELQQLIDRKDNELLLYLLEMGMVNHASGKYAEAIANFKDAEKIAALVDYTSVSQEVGSVLFNDSAKAYKGEDFEKILINVYMAIDYTMLGKWDEALVECRRVNKKLGIMISEGKMQSYRITRCKIGFRSIADMPEWMILMEFRDMGQMDSAFRRVAPLEGDLETKHKSFNQFVAGDIQHALFRDWPDQF